MMERFGEFKNKSSLLGFATVLLVVLLYSMAMAGKGGGDEHGHEYEHEHEHHDEHEHAETQESEKKDAHKDEHGHSEGEEEEVSGPIGPGKAVEAVDAKAKRFKLSAKARTVIGIKLAKARGAGSRVVVPRESVVEFGSEYGVYVERDGWFHLEEVRVVSRSNEEWTVAGGGLRPGSSIAIEGVGLLRVAELDAFGGGSHGHSH